MKVTQLHLAGQGARRDLAIESFGPQLNLLVGPSGVGKSTVAGLLGHLLYGKTVGRAQAPSVPQTLLPEGSVDVTSAQGPYVLRRHRDGSPFGRLSIASAGGTAVDSRTIRSLLSDVSPRLLAELYAVDFAQANGVNTLLSGEFAREFTAALTTDGTAATPAPTCPDRQEAITSSIDRRQLDELVQRRDAVVRDIELRMSGSRRSSDALDRELKELDAALSARRQQVEPLQAKLRAADARLAEIEATLRFFSIENAVRRGPVIDDDRQQALIDQLDAEISRCRQTLSDLQLRDATVRRELAEVHPDGTADSASCLADQRATVGVFERLLDDLDAEVAQLARSHEPGRCVGCDSHKRFSPVAQMLRQQLYTLCGQVTEQERTVRRVQLHAEARQLARAQTDLSEQLEHLLQRRQSLVHESQLAQRPVVMLPQLPVTAHCQCEGHAHFVRDADAMLLARTDRSRREQIVSAQRVEVERARDEHRAACDALHQEIASLEAKWRRLQQQRAQLSERGSLDELRRELERLETEIERTLEGRSTTQFFQAPAGSHRRVWKASDALAQLTGGELSQIRLSRDGEAAVIDRQGRSLAANELTAAQQDQLYLAVTVALASSFANRGIDLPLVLDEPFKRQDARDAAAMASVLQEFARQGQQVIVLTANVDATRRFESLGVAPLDLDALRHRPATPPVLKVATPPAHESARAVRIVRETVGQRQPNLRLAKQAAASREDRVVYYLTPAASMSDFPVLGNDTAAVFATLGIDTVEHLLEADAEDVAARLKRAGISAATVRLWQSHISLMCFIPGVSLNEVQVLAACEISSPEAIFVADPRMLAADVERFFASDRGQRFAHLRPRFTRERITELQRLARGQRGRWLAASRSYNWIDHSFRSTSPDTARTSQVKSPAPAAKAPKKKPSESQPAVRARTKPLEFLLGLHSPVEQAPSIDAAAAELLGSAGIRTVADLLHANPESTAEELGDARLSAAAIARWQAESRLACRIPELRCFGAQLLVATGYTEPEQVAAAKAAEMFNKVKTLCRTPQGKRFLREGNAPSRERIAQWIRHASQMRPLEAA